MADKKTVVKKDAAKPAVEKKAPTAAQIACVKAGFTYEALSDTVKKELDTVAASLDKLGDYFSPQILLTLSSSLVTSGSVEIVIVEPKHQAQGESK